MDIHRNYQKELDKLIEKNQKAGKRPRLLLHACCAPCSSYVLEYLTKYFDISIYFYNPNIDTEEEYYKRAEELSGMIEKMGLSSKVKLIIGKYEPKVFYEAVKGHERDPERGERCHICYELRLRKTCELASEYEERGEGFDYYCTTLTISPLKDAESLNCIGESLSGIYSIDFLNSDFKKREGYKRSIELSREYGLYRQDYCGCIFSKSIDRAQLEK